MDTLMSEKGNFVLSPEGDGEPVKRTEDGCDVVIFSHPHQYPCSTVLDVLEPLKSVFVDPNEQ